MSKKYYFVYEQIGKRIREKRDSLDLSQEDLASHLDLTRSSIANMESGKQQIYIHQLCEIAEKFQVSLDDLLPDSEWIANVNDDDQLKSKIDGAMPEKSAKNITRKLDL
jgi:transcriptional regulator with XRE-family HTH domain